MDKYNKLSTSKKTGLWLSRTLKAKKISQEDFAEMLDCDPRTIRRYVKNGISNIDLISSIACHLDYSLLDALQEIVSEKK